MILLSEKICLYASIVKPFGHKNTLFAITNASALSDLTITWTKGNKQMSEATKIMTWIKASQKSNFHLFSPTALLTELPLSTVYKRPSSPIFFAARSAEITKINPITAWNNPSAVARL